MRIGYSMNTYEYSFTSKCPNDEHGYIFYTAIIKSKKIIMVEDIIKHCADNYKKEYHENIADGLIKRFGGSQRLIAVHKKVKITTIRISHEDNA